MCSSGDSGLVNSAQHSVQLALMLDRSDAAECCISMHYNLGLSTLACLVDYGTFAVSINVRRHVHTKERIVDRDLSCQGFVARRVVNICFDTGHKADTRHKALCLVSALSIISLYDQSDVVVL